MNETILEPKGLNRLTENAKRILKASGITALEFHFKEIDLMHFFYQILKEKNGITNEIFVKLGIDVEPTLARIEKELEKNKTTKPEVKILEPDFSEQLKELIRQGFITSSEMGHVYVGTEHLLAAMFKLDGVDFIEEMKKAGISYDGIKKIVLTTGSYSTLTNMGKFDYEMQQESKSLGYFSRNLNESAQSGELPNITGRDKEIQRLIHILSRKTKNNAILVGDAGVGKTAIVEGLTNLIVQKKIPTSFMNVKILSLDVGLIISGAKLRGDVEERVNAIIQEAVSDPNIILFIDEIHNIVGAGSAGGRDSMDIANMLKPYLTGTDLRVIGATTNDEYTKYFEEDSALARRFQPIYVEELDTASAKTVIKNLIPAFESFHKVKISEEVADVSVDLSSKFIKDRYLPDKAIDLIDEAAASVKIGRELEMEPLLSELGEELIKVQNKKNDLVKKSDFKEASKLKDKEESLMDQIENVIEGKTKAGKRSYKSVSVDLIKNILVDWTKIPIVASDISDKRLKDLSSRLSKRIIGQERIVENVSKAIQRSHLGLTGDNRPLGSFMFLGPTGVGKTELAKTLAKEVFGSSNLLYQINMSEFMESHSVAKLIGSPPGYVGYQEGGQLTTFVKRRPYSVILFDEIEKASPDVLNILLQILEEGELADGKGARVSFKNAIVIMTSNIGADDVSSDSKLGFDVKLDTIDKTQVDSAYEDMRDRIMTVLKNTLRPELLNRIDLIDIFRGLNKEDCLEISRIIVNEFISRILPRGIVLEVDSDVINKINEDGYSKEYGGRNIRRKVQEILENSLAEFLMSANLKRNKSKLVKLHAKLVKGNVTYSVE